MGILQLMHMLWCGLCDVVLVGQVCVLMLGDGELDCGSGLPVLIGVFFGWADGSVGTLAFDTFSCIICAEAGKMPALASFRADLVCLAIFCFVAILVAL